MDINQVLDNLKATSNGEYYLLCCPHCGYKEAYCYIDDIKKWGENHSHKIPIRCNRMNKCGKVSYLNDYLKEVNTNTPLKIKESNPVQMSVEGVHLLQKFGKYVVEALYCQTEDYNFDLRGISNKTLKENGIIYYKKMFESLINQENTKKLYGDKYRSNSYKNRDIMIPILNVDGVPERFLLRSKKPSPDAKKEIQLMLVKKGLEIWNIKDILEHKVVFVTEGAYDALSIKEVCPQTGVIALPGVNKYKQLMKFIKKYPGSERNTFIFAFDNDEAGVEFMNRVINDFNKEKIKNITMSFYKYKDCNEYLNQDKEGFSSKVNKIYKTAQKRYL